MVEQATTFHYFYTPDLASVFFFRCFLLNAVRSAVTANYLAEEVRHPISCISVFVLVGDDDLWWGLSMRRVNASMRTS